MSETIQENCPHCNSFSKNEEDYDRYNSLYPVHSENTINRSCKAISEGYRDLGFRWKQFAETEHAEAKKHKELGLDQSTFKPSSLLWLLQEINHIATKKNDREKELEKMIEANIRVFGSVLNGMSIKEASEKEHEDKGYPTVMTGMTEEWKSCDEFINEQKKHWREDWDNLGK